MWWSEQGAELVSPPSTAKVPVTEASVQGPSIRGLTLHWTQCPRVFPLVRGVLGSNLRKGGFQREKERARRV